METAVEDVRKRAKARGSRIEEFFEVFILRKCTSDTCPATISAISSYVFPVAVNASVRVDSPENMERKTPHQQTYLG